MKKIWLLATLLVGSLLLTGCFEKDLPLEDECISWEMCELEDINGEDTQKYDEWSDSGFFPESNILKVDENKILSTNELKKACEKLLWGEKSENIVTTRTDEKLFINTYSFKGITETDWINTVYCNVTLDWVVLDAAFYLDKWQTIEELHKQLDYTPWSSYPNLKEYYWFVWTIVLWNRLQTTYITWKNTMYFDDSRWIAFKLWEEFDWWLIREIDTDEGWFPHSEIILLVKWEKNEENRTGINWYREVYTIRVDSKTNLENFNINPDLANAIWENNEYYFVWYGIDTNIHFSDLQIFDVEDKVIAQNSPLVEEYVIHTWCNKYINNEFWFQIDLSDWTNSCKITYNYYPYSSQSINVVLWSLPLNDYWWFEWWGDFETITIIAKDEEIRDKDPLFNYDEVSAENNKYKFYRISWSASPSFYETYIPLNGDEKFSVFDI